MSGGWLFSRERIRLTPGEFAEFKERDPDHGKPYTRYKTLINGRWYVTHRAFSYGVPYKWAHPVVIVIPGC